MATENSLNHLNHNGREVISQSLRDVAVHDYFATQKLIREMFIPGFDTKKYDEEILNAYSWMASHPMDISLLTSTDNLPDFVRRHKYTISMFLDIGKEVSSSDPMYGEPVAFQLSSKGLREEIMRIKEEDWSGLASRVAEVHEDLLSVSVFFKYWVRLRERARFMKKNEEPSGSI